MGKRSNKGRNRRQCDPQDEGTGTSDEETAKKCTHLAKGLNLPQLKKFIVQGSKFDECDECAKSPESNTVVSSSANEQDSHLPNLLIEKNDDKTVDDEDGHAEEITEKGSWICLQCGHRGCGRDQKQHALSHYKTPHSSSHDLAVDSISWMTWCYKCDDYVTCDSSRLTQAIDFIRKQSGLTGKPGKVSLSMKRSQSQFDTKESFKNSTNTDVKKIDSTDKDIKDKDTCNNELASLPPVKGLTNLGNTCFFNSVMQVLSQTHWLTQLLDLEVRDGHVFKLRGSESGPSCTSSCSTLSELENCDSGVGSLLENENVEEYSVTEPISVILGPGKPLTLTLASFLKDMHCPAAAGNSNKRRQSSSTVTPSSLFNQISKKSPQFRGFQQQDAHELLRHLLDGVRTEEITRRRHAIMNHFNVPLNVVKNQPTDIDPLLKRKLKVYGKESAHTFVDQLFGGQLLSTVICESCHQPYQILEPFMDLSLPVSEDKSPPTSTKRKPSTEPVACLAPSSPTLKSKHQRKKERKAGYKSKSKAFNSEDVVIEGDSSILDEPPAASTPLDEMVSVEGSSKTGKISPDLSTKEDEGLGDENSSASSGREEEDDEDEGGDVEDNNEEQEKDIEDLISKMEQTQVDAIKDEDSISQHKMDCPVNTTTSKKIRTEWVAKSLCSLAVRYQPTNQECSVQSCLNLFTAPELLTGSNKYGCENCTRRKAAAALADGTATEGTKIPTVYSVASKQLLIFAPPALLTLHLKRFTQNGVTLRKAQKHVDFPLRFDLAPFCSAAAAGVTSVPANQKEVIYSLYGVIEHSGRLSQGHYTAFVKVRPVASQSLTKFLQQLSMQTDDLYRLRDQISDRLLAERSGNPSTTTTENGSDVSTQSNTEGVWYYCSDSHVMGVSEEKVLRSQAFLLFYERVL